MFSWIARRVAPIYDMLDRPDWRHRLEIAVVVLASYGFLIHLLLIFLAQQVPLLRNGILAGLDRNFLHAVYTPFSFILFYEVLLLVLALPKSHTSSIGKQYEIISLIIVRRVFKDIGEFRDLESWLMQTDATRMVLFDMAGAAATFLFVAFFYRLRRTVRKSSSRRDLDDFIRLKKTVAVLLSGLLFILAGRSMLTWGTSILPGQLTQHVAPRDLDLFFFPQFFECMIFTDVLLLIVSISYYDRYQYVFRNAGFVISTVLLRFSLSTAKPYDVALALVAMLYGLVVLSIFAYFTRTNLDGPGSETTTCNHPEAVPGSSS